MGRSTLNVVTASDVEKAVYRAFRSAWEEERGGGVAPSNVVRVTELVQCLLKSWLERVHGYSPSDRKLVVLVLGDDVHYLMSARFPLGEGEVRVEKEYRGVKIRGRVDRILGDAVLEFKTASRVPLSPLDHHVDQLQLYLWLTGRRRGFIVYVSKVSGEVRVFEVVKDEERISELLDRALTLSKSLREGIRPKPESGWLCKFCEYKHGCS